MDLLTPMVSRSATSTSAGPYGGGTTTKSPSLTARPIGVVTVMRPPIADPGTVVVNVVPDDAPVIATRPFRSMRLLSAAGSKLAPLIVNAVPATPIVGLKPEMSGRPRFSTIVNGVRLVADPDG